MPTVRTPEAPCYHSPSRGARCCLPLPRDGVGPSNHRSISGADLSVHLRSGLQFRCLRFAAGRYRTATQDSVRRLLARPCRGCHFRRLCLTSLSRRNPRQIRTCGFCRIRLRRQMASLLRRQRTRWSRKPGDGHRHPYGVWRCYETRRLLAVHPPSRFVAFAPAVPSEHLRFAPSDARCDVHGLGLGEPVPAPRQPLRMETMRASRVPGKPTRTHATRSDPGKVPASTASREAANVAFRPTHDVGPRDINAFRGCAITRAYALPVNASRPSSPLRPRRIRSVPAGGRPCAGWGWKYSSTGFRTKVSARSHHGILSPLTGLSRHTRCCHEVRQAA